MFKASLFILFFGLQQVHAESLGEIEIDDVHIRTSFNYQDPHQGSFQLNESGVGVLWQKGKNISGRMRIGSVAQIGRPAVFTDDPESDLGFYEAYGQYSGAYGQLRAGLIPIGFGYEGSLIESDLHFARNLLFTTRTMGLRDYGFSYEVGYKGFNTHFAVHNGEAEADNPDGRIFYTVNWSWAYDEKTKTGISAQVAETKPESTGGVKPVNATPVGAFDPGEVSKWRIVDFYFHKKSSKLLFDFEAYFGEAIQNDFETRFWGGHLDLVYEPKKKYLVLLRYDYLDPSDIVDDNALQELTFGLGYKTNSGNSTWYLLATQPIEEGQSINNNRYSLVWKLTPKFLD